MIDKTNPIQSYVIEEIKAIAYFWINERNPEFSLSIINLLNFLNYEELDKKKYQEIQDLKKDWDAIFLADPVHKKNMKDIKKNSKQKIPVEYNVDEEKKLLYIATVVIVNSFNICEYNLSYSALMKLGKEWPELYASVVYMYRTMDSQYKESLIVWLTEHFLLATDIADNHVIDFGEFYVTMNKKKPKENKI